MCNSPNISGLCQRKSKCKLNGGVDESSATGGQLPSGGVWKVEVKTITLVIFIICFVAVMPQWLECCIEG